MVCLELTLFDFVEIVILSPLSEEFYFRFFWFYIVFLQLLGRVIGKVVVANNLGEKFLLLSYTTMALIIQSLFFVFHHPPSNDYVLLFLSGIIYGVAYLTSRDLFLPVLLHATNNLLPQIFCVSG